MSSFFLPHPLLFKIGSLVITTHGLFFALGAEVALLVAIFIASRLQLPENKIGGWVIAIFAGGLVAARIGFFVSYPQQFHSLGEVLAVWHGGLVSYWGIIGGLFLAIFLVRQEAAAPIGRWMDIIVVSALAGWSVGRWGNYWAADSVGVLSNHFALFYGRVPIQLFESGLCAFLTVVLGYTLLRTPPSGSIATLGLAGYGIGRAVIDIWREEGSLAGLHYSQWVSICLASIAVLYLVKLRHQHAH